MGKIKRLPPQLISKLAAGEVVERPASVVKELIENSIDAGSTKIEVRTKGGGSEYIGIMDNGTGMEEEDALLAVEEYSTSKISSLDGLYHIDTLGFRGEALHAISSVSRITLFTSPGDLGIELKVEGGVLKNIGKRPRVRGTTVEVRDIFFNLRARRRFLRSPAVEMGHITQVIKEYALAFPRIHFLLKEGEKLLFDLSPTELEARVAEVWNVEPSELISMEGEREKISLYGVISSPRISRKDTRGEIIFIRGRPVRDRLLMAAIRDAYGTFLVKGEYPIVALFIELPPEDVDVNVHPSKREVKFKSPSLLYQVVRDSLRGCLGARKATSLSPSSFPGLPPYGFVSQGVSEGHLPYEAPPFRFLGEFGSLYLLFERDGKELLIVDKHALHERLLFDEILKGLEEGENSHPLLFPAEFSLEAELKERFEELIPQFERLGFVLKSNREDSYEIKAVPAWLKGDPAALLKGILLEEEGNLDPHMVARAAQAACKLAQRAGDFASSLDVAEVVRVIMEKGTELTCPHGRPVVISLSRDWLERLFKRRV